MQLTKLQQVEKEIATLLLEKLENEEMTLERAAEISKYIMQSLPQNLTDEQLDRILPSLDDHFIELADVVNKHLQEKTMIEKQAMVDETKKLVNQGNVEQALHFLKNHVQTKI